MIILALDMSKTSTGWALWDSARDKPVYGHWVLGSAFTSDGGVFAKLHQHLHDLHQVMPFDSLYFEQKINPVNLQGHTTISTINLLSGLEAHAKSFGHVFGLRIVKAVSLDHWRPDFIGKFEHSDAKARARRARKEGDTRASARKDLKDLTMERCRLLGFTPRNDDEGDALGILDYACGLEGLTPPWRAAEVLRPMLGSAAR